MGDVQDGGELLPLLETSLRGFLAQQHRRGRIRDDRGGFAALWPQMAQLGLLGLLLPEADGGAGLGLDGLVLVSRILGEQLVPEPVAACAAMPAALVAALPPGQRRLQLASELVSGATRLAVGWQETPGQTSAWPVACEIDGAGRFSGEKIYVVAPERQAFISAVHAGEPAIGLVDLSEPLVATTYADTSDGAPYAAIRFTGARLTDGAPLLRGRAAEAALDSALEAGLLANAAQLAGLAAGVFELTLEHLRTRVQFGRPIGAFQALQHRAVDLQTLLALAEASLREACRTAQRDPGSRRAQAAVSAAKARTATAAAAACKEAIQMHGAMGFTEEADVGLFAAAALKWSSWLGGPTEHRRRFLASGGDLLDAA